MSKKRIKKKNLKDFKSLIRSDIFKKKIEIAPTDLLINTKKKKFQIFMKITKRTKKKRKSN